MNQIEKAKEVLNRNGVVIFPTETTFAVGCRLDSKTAVKKLYSLKQRPQSQPTSIVCENLEQVLNYCYLTPKEEILAQTFWPGPLTICLKPKENVPNNLLATDRTIGVRVPGFTWLRELIKTVGVPLLSPSANFRGEAPPIKLTQIDKKLADLVDYVVNIEPEGKNPSTIVRLENSKVTIIREGIIEKNKIEESLKGVKTSESIIE